MKLTPAILATSLAPLLIPACSPESPSDKPNIILINVDDLGWRDLGYTGSQYYETPNIDRLANEGMIFTNGYASAANCAPSRACLMTGLWPQRHGIFTVGNSDRGKSRHRKLIPTPNNTVLAPEFEIIPEYLSRQGYTSLHSGKWHLSADPSGYGFDVNIGARHSGHLLNYNPPYGNVDLENPGDTYLTDLIMDRSLAVLDTLPQPFFFYYAPYAVHTPIQGVDSLVGKYRAKTPWKGQGNPEYASMIDNLDRNIGRLVRFTEDKGIRKNTLFIFTSDNGGLYGITKQLPLRAGKGSYYEGGIRVALFFTWDGVIEPGGLTDVAVSNLDILPTLAEVAGISAGEVRADGISVLPLLKGQAELPERPLYWHFPIYLQAYNVNDNQNRDSLFRTRPGSVIRMGKWKLHHYYEDDGIELYNLEEDIGEKVNLAEKDTAVSRYLYRMLDEWREETGAPEPVGLGSGEALEMRGFGD